MFGSLLSTASQVLWARLRLALTFRLRTILHLTPDLSPLPDSVRASHSQNLVRLLINAESLTTPAVSRVFLGFFFCLSLNSTTLLRQRTSCVFFCRFYSSVSP